MRNRWMGGGSGDIHGEHARRTTVGQAQDQLREKRVSRARKEKRDMQLGVAGERSVVMTHGGVGSGQIVGIPEQRCRE